jgi:hypothetical protein
MMFYLLDCWLDLQECVLSRTIEDVQNGAVSGAVKAVELIAADNDVVSESGMTLLLRLLSCVV